MIGLPPAMGLRPGRVVSPPTLRPKADDQMRLLRPPPTGHQAGPADRQLRLID